jgi:hypothetical protein
MNSTLGPERQPGLGGFFSHAHNFALHNPLIGSVQGDHNTVTYIQSDRNLVSQCGCYCIPFRAIRAHLVFW